MKIGDKVKHKDTNRTGKIIDTTFEGRECIVQFKDYRMVLDKNKLEVIK